MSILERWAIVFDGANGPARPLASGELFPARARVRFLEIADDDAPIVTLSLRSRNGQAEFEGISVNLPHQLVQYELTPTYLRTYFRQLRVGEMRDAAVRVIARVVASATQSPWIRDPDSAASNALHARRRRGLTDEFLAEVSRIANEHPNAHTKAVHEELGEPHGYDYRTAARWVAEAKKRGFPMPRNNERTAR